MLPRERVDATLKHEEPDLVPWGEHSIDYNIYEMALGRETWVHAKFREQQGMWDGKRDEIVQCYKRDVVDLADALDFDIITVGQNAAKGAHPEPLEKIDEETYKSGPHLYRISATTGALMPYKIDTSGYEAPTVEQIQDQIAHLEANPPQKPEDSCWEVFRHVVKERKGTHWINTCVGGMGFPVTGPTDEIRYMNMALHPELLGPVAELQAKHCMATLEWYAEEGADSVMPCADLGSSTGLFGNPRILEEHVEHWWKAYNDKAHSLGMKVVKHCCGHIWEALPAMIRSGFDGYEGVQASGGMDMKELKDKYGDQFTFWGGIWHEHLILGSAEEIDEDARYSIGHGAPGGGFIYGSSHSLAVGCRPENLEMMKDARARYGVYPIDAALRDD